LATTEFFGHANADIDGDPTTVTATAGWLSNSDIDTDAAATPHSSQTAFTAVWATTSKHGNIHS